MVKMIGPGNYAMWKIKGKKAIDCKKKEWMFINIY